MTLVTARLILLSELCFEHEKYENDIQIYTYVCIVYRHRICHCFNCKICKQIKKHSKMKKNMSSADRIIRLLLSAIMVTLYFTNVVGGTVGIILLVLAGVFTLTSIISFCPLYAIFGISTCPVKTQ